MGETVCVVELVIPMGVADPSLAGGPFMNHIEHAAECPTEEWEPGHVPADCHSSLFKGCEDSLHRTFGLLTCKQHQSALQALSPRLH